MLAGSYDDANGGTVILDDPGDTVYAFVYVDNAEVPQGDRYLLTPYLE